jgi:hypothetical protein
MITTLLAVAMLAAAPADDAGGAANDAPKKYTPEIRGQLLDGTRPVASNVCLRQSGSEIRTCGYTDFSGHFYIPSSGPLRSVRPSTDDNGVSTFPTYWLEIGRVTEARKIAPVETSADKRAALVLECNLARGSGAADAADFCRRSSGDAAATSRVSQAEPGRRPAPAHPGK